LKSKKLFIIEIEGGQRLHNFFAHRLIYK